MKSILAGIGGWTFAPWRGGAFYPEGLPHARELEHASRQVTAIEINGTFYRQQTEASFSTWRDATPDGFVFAVKAHRATTQTTDMAKAEAAIARFLGSGLKALGKKLGPILWQLPPTRKFDKDAMEAFLTLLPERNGALRLRHAVEARHPSFADPAYVALLRKHGVALVIVDSDKQALACEITAPFVYARLQRNDATAPEGYDSAALDDWAGRAKAWAGGKPPRDCFIFFISGDKQRAPDAARAFIRRVAKPSS